MTLDNPAPGWPGIPARWTSSAKSGVGTALEATSRVWFTISHGILNEIYYPRVDQACTRDFGLIVTDGKSFFSEEKRDTRSEIHTASDGVPAFVIVSTCNQGRYRLEKLVICDPRRDVLLQRVMFHALTGTIGDYRIYALLAPHLVNRGANNNAWLADYKGLPMLFADRADAGAALALGCSAGFGARSVGFVGTSDGWQDLSQHFELRWRYDHAHDGNVALTGEVDLAGCDGRFVLALGFGRRAEEAAFRVRASLTDGIEQATRDYVAGWRKWQDSLLPLDRTSRGTGHNTYRISTSVLRSHEARSFQGGYIASLSIPWGFSKGDEDLGGYHLIWPRDLVQTAGGLLAAGAKDAARDVGRYLRTIQEPDGHWPQNCWLDGTPYWTGIQMDECAFPILLVDLAWREGAITESELPGLWPMLRRAAGYIVRNGPVTGQDRWEEDGGYSPFTLAVEIAGLLAAADLADHLGARQDASYLRETADLWNSQIEHWIYATGTPLAQKLGIDGHYVRIAPSDAAGPPLDGYLTIKNRPASASQQRASASVSPDALALVRFGLRAPDDPRILNTVRVIDELLKVDLPAGPCWRRYNGDGYGEHDDGEPFDGTGTGRPWPLLTGERAHYELAAANRAGAFRLLAAMEGFASEGHLIPEQVWDGPDIPERELFRGRPSGSAMPLVWAHAEHLKLIRSLTDGKVFDMPPQPRERYQVKRVSSHLAMWRFNHKCHRLPSGRVLRIELPEPASIRWSVDNWRTIVDTKTTDSGLGVHYADVDTTRLATGAQIVFTILWTTENRWEGVDHTLTVT